MRNLTKSAVLGSVCLAVLCPVSVVAQSIEESGGEASEKDAGAIIVTGSRVARSGLDAPTPRTVVDSELMNNLGQTNVAETIRLIPQNVPSASDTNVGYGTSPNAGSAFVNLRGLNPSDGVRTLTLVNSRRFVPSSDGGAVDLNVIPSAIIDRVETVTGGASAAYGSDAIAGVVNVILDEDFTGLKGEMSYGQTARGDGNDYYGSLAWGTKFANDRGHFAIAVEYQNQGGVGNCSEVREWCAEGWDIFINDRTVLPDGTLSGYNIVGSPGYGLPQYIIGPDSRQAPNILEGGVRNRAPAAIAARNYRFTADGKGIIYNDPGLYVPSTSFGARQGGYGESTYANSPLRTPVERYLGYMYGSYELSENWKLSAEFNYARRNVSAVGAVVGPRSDYLVKPTNAYLPDALKTLLNGTSFSLAKDLDAQIQNLNTVNADVYRGTIGLSGELGGGWFLDAYYQYGVNKRKQVASRARVNSPFIWALDAVVDPDTQEIVCAETLKANPDPRALNCVPMNLFGLTNLTQDAIDYVYRPIYEDFNFTQHAASVAIRGEFFPNRSAGPVAVAAGVDFRDEKGDVWHHDIPDYQDYGLTFGQDYAGSIQVLEGFGEINAPLFKDWVLGESFEFNAAGRWTQNKSHNEVTDESKTINALSWKLGAVYQPVSMLRFRATRSRDIRVAGFRELFQINTPGEPCSAQGRVDNPAIPGSPAGGDDCTPILGGGSFQLGAEKADTTTAGVLFEPEFIPGFRFGVDWYQIDIKDAVTALSAQRIVDFCDEYDRFCDRISYNGGDITDITYIDARLVNLGRFTLRGFDIEAQYRLPLSSISGGWDGTLDFRVVGTHQYDFQIQPATDIAPVDYAGSVGDIRDSGDFSSGPKWLWSGFLTYSTERFTGTLHVRHVGAGLLDVTKVGPDNPAYDPKATNSISDNTVDAATYFSLGLSYRIPAFGQNDGIEVFGVIDNLFDKKPAVAPGGGGVNLGSFYPTNPAYFDTLGMRWKAGVRFQM